MLTPKARAILEFFTPPEMAALSRLLMHNSGADEAGAAFTEALDALKKHDYKSFFRAIGKGSGLGHPLAARAYSLAKKFWRGDQNDPKPWFAKGFYEVRSFSMSASRSSGDPYWITVKYPGTARDGTPVKKGDRALYYPRTKAMLVGPAAEKAWREFSSQIQDEKVFNMSASKSDLRSSILRLAHEHPELRAELVPLLRRQSADATDVPEPGSKPIRLTPKELARADGDTVIITRPWVGGTTMVAAVHTGSGALITYYLVDSDKGTVSQAVREVARWLSKMGQSGGAWDASRHRKAPRQYLDDHWKSYDSGLV